MADTDKVLQALERLENGQQTLQATVAHQGKQLAALQSDMTTVKAQVGKIPAIQQQLDTVEVKVEAFHSEQKTANKGMISVLHEIGEVNAQAAEKRFTRIERHLNLPPVK
jgi:hypothetical protein